MNDRTEECLLDWEELNRMLDPRDEFGMVESATIESIYGNNRPSLYPKNLAAMVRQTPKSPAPHLGCTVHFDKRQMILITCNGKQALACADTGAPISIITLDKYHSLCPENLNGKEYFEQEIIQYSRDIVIPTLNGEIEAIGMTTLPIKIGEGIFLIKFQVIKDCDIDIIIGEDFFDECKALINYKDRSITVQPQSLLTTIACINIPPHTTQQISLKAEYSTSDLDYKAPVKVKLHDSIKRVNLYPEDNHVINNEIRVNIENKGSEPLYFSEGFDIATSNFSTEKENVLMDLSKCLEKNRSEKIGELEGVTRTDNEYWEAIGQIKLEKSLLSKKEKEYLLDKVFEQRGALAIGDEVGCLKRFRYEIKMKPHKIFNKPSYKMNAIGREILQKKIDIFIENGVVQPFMSEYSSPALLVRKPQYKGVKDITKVKFRMVIDLREMNESAVHLKYSLPVIHETITELDPSRDKYISIFDISDAFYQIALLPESYMYTTFKVPLMGSYCLKRLPQGYVAAPSIFQAVSENIFPASIKQYITCYIDDILIMTETKEKHLEVIELVLYTLRQNGMKLKIEKCNICPEELDFLGFTLCSKGVKVKADKVEAIVKIPRPRTKTQVRQFLGASGWYRRYIPGYAGEAKPLHEKTQDIYPDKNIPWDDAAEKSFEKLKKLLVEAPILGHMDYDNDTVLRTDCSGVALGGTLAQFGKDKREYVVAYYSRVLQPHEYNYDITSREALAVLSSVKNWATYLRFIHFLIRSDHNNLKYIFKVQKSKQESHRLIRWATYLSGFDFNIQFCSGDSPEIRMTDFLSRYHYEEKNDEIGAIARSLDPDELRYLEDNCPDCSTDSHEKISYTKKLLVPDSELLKRRRVARISSHDTQELDTVRAMEKLDVNAPEFVPCLESKSKEMYPKLFTEEIVPEPKADETFDGPIQNEHELEIEQKNNGNLSIEHECEREIEPEIEETSKPDSGDESDQELIDEINKELGFDSNDEGNQSEYSNIEHEYESDLDGRVFWQEPDKDNDHYDSEYPHLDDLPVDTIEQPVPQLELEHPVYTTDLEDDAEIATRTEDPADQTIYEISRYQAMTKGMESYEHNTFSRKELRKLLDKDRFAREIMAYLNKRVILSKGHTKRIVTLSEQFYIDQRTGLLYHFEYPAGGLVTSECTTQLYIPAVLTNYVIEFYHAQKHSGLEGIMAQIKERYWFPTMPSRIQHLIDNCAICQLTKKIRNPYTPEIKPRKLPTQPGEIWYLDHLGPLRYPKKGDEDGKKGKIKGKSKRQFWKQKEGKTGKETEKKREKEYILVAVDSYSLYTELIPCYGTTGIETAEKIYERIFLVHGWPRAIIHDQGTAFANKILSFITKNLGIRNYQTAAMNPRSNGVAESRVKIVSIALSKLVNEKKGHWKEYVPVIQFAMNTVPTGANSVAPFTLQYGRLPTDPLSLALIEDKSLLSTQLEYLSRVIFKTRKWRDTVRKRREVYNRLMLKQHEHEIRTPDEIAVGEFCYMHVPFYDHATKGIRRLNIPWRGPFVIEEVLQDKRFVMLVRVEDFIKIPKRVHVNRIKVTKMGLNPPQYEKVPGFTPDYTEERNDEVDESLIVNEGMTQRWDDVDLVPYDEEDARNVKQSLGIEIVNEDPKVEIKIEGEEDPQTHIKGEEESEKSQETSKSGLVQPAHGQVYSNLDEIKQVEKDESIESENSGEVLNTAQIYVRMPPKAKTTRRGNEGMEGEERVLREIVGYKLKGDDLMLKVWCVGDHRKNAFWIGRWSIEGDHVDEIVEKYKATQGIK
jgi:hypothetical protein